MSNRKSNIQNYAIGAGLYETTSRYGSAGAEFLKGLRGVDNETGKVFNRSLLKISEGKINPDYAEQNIKQQAGFSAEVAGVSKRNAEAIIDGRKNRFSRSEDLSGYGSDNTTVDIIELLDGKEISNSQMKFVSNPDGLLKKIARGEGGGKNDLSRYMKVDKLEVPTEQVEQMKATCRTQAEKLQQQAEKARERGDTALAEKLQKQSDNYKKLETKIADSGMTTEEAIRYRNNPRWETAKDIAGVSHRAGIEGAKFGAAIGGGISALSNIVAVWSGDKEFGEAVADTAADTLVSAGVGYGTAFAGSAIKGYMQQSANVTARALSKTGLPAMIVSSCLAATKSITRYAKGEIDELGLTEEMSMVAAAALSGSAFTVLGQIAIPIPVLGGLIGGMIGYAVTNAFHQGFFAALRDAKLSAERRQMVEMKCAAARELAQRYEQAINETFERKLTRLGMESRAMFALLDNPDISADDFCAGMNRFAEMLGRKISINNMAELDAAMLTDDPLVI
ncbi:hypothetical protein [Neisseria animalis]|uniref:Uncharacterized protein n=1 Tax=Neisseria animalis TaxID=492 RepID=A0A5P3MU68_NEIAN|nr:hypothetical protein [Neisseria animalis]QEY24605.1 hypothetical protein D0T90_09115 [Neisseria animalis]ROW32982.1 hypothetical protein CGZ60_01610 [Neisseria animalis]VEE07463.1 Uncharacterised protein [Neisseria animalis]